MDKGQNIIGFSPRVPVRVLGCLSRTTITVILCPDIGLADGGNRTNVLIGAVPLDLRMPNSEFDMIFDCQQRSCTRVVRKGEPDAEGVKT